MSNKTHKQKRRKAIRGVCITLLILALLSLHPTIRAVIWLILPLGSGTDDVIAAILLVLAVTIYAMHVRTDKKEQKAIKRLFEDKEGV
jgi:hypothetical protein